MNQQHLKRSSRPWPWILGFGIVAVTCVWALQYQSLRRLRAEVKALQVQLAGVTPAATVAPAAPDTSHPQQAPIVIPSSNVEWDQRLRTLQESVTRLSEATDYLMERGMLPLAAHKVEDLVRRLGDASASDADRLRILNLLRRNNGLTDTGIYHALTWLNSTTNANTKRTLLQRLDGETNAILKGPLLALAHSATDENIREEAVDNLAHFRSDPQVQQTLWNLFLNDPDGGVRREAEQALRNLPISPGQTAALQERVLQPDASLDSRLTALSALRRWDAASPELLTAVAGMAQQSEDPAIRVRILQALDDTKVAMLREPLVQSLQDPNPLVREEAADALSGLSADPLVEQWLRYVADNDQDPRVQREAMRALQDDNRRR